VESFGSGLSRSDAVQIGAFCVGTGEKDPPQSLLVPILQPDIAPDALERMGFKASAGKRATADNIRFRVSGKVGNRGGGGQKFKEGSKGGGGKPFFRERLGLVANFLVKATFFLWYLW
jgi:hypothetical protein